MSESGTEQGTPTFLFDETAAEHVISAFGWELTNTGYIWEDDVVPSIQGHPVHINDLAGIIEYEGEPRPLSDDFTELIDYVKYRHEDECNVDAEGDQ